MITGHKHSYIEYSTIQKSYETNSYQSWNSQSFKTNNYDGNQNSGTSTTNIKVTGPIDANIGHEIRPKNMLVQFIIKVDVHILK